MSKIPVIDIEEARKHLGNYNLVTTVIRWINDPKKEVIFCPLEQHKSQCEKLCEAIFKNLTLRRKSTSLDCPCASYGVKRTVAALRQLMEDLL